MTETLLLNVFATYTKFVRGFTATALGSLCTVIVAGGFTPYEALTTATHNPAKWLALEDKLGVIKPGAQADLSFVTGNPLTDIRNTTSLRYVMKNGRLYDATTLDQITPIAKKMDKLWWLQLEPTEGTR